MMKQLNTCKESNPLSFAQQRLWFFEQLEPSSPTYHISKGLHLQGNLNVEVLQQTLDAIVAHNEALRTNFIAQDGIPVQLINEPKLVELLVIDLRDCPETERTTQVERLLEDEVQRPFNLQYLRQKYEWQKGFCPSPCRDVAQNSLYVYSIKAIGCCILTKFR